MNEFERQRSLLAAILSGDASAHLGLNESDARAARGLMAYRANAEAVAERALAAVCPTVRAMLGLEDFARLAGEFRSAHPPVQGDLGEWGEAMPPWLEGHAGLTAWPWLGDCARLDLAVHRAERAVDASAELASLALLESVDPAALGLALMPGTSLLGSRWPIATIHAAHALPAAEADAAFAAVRGALAAGRAEQALVVRRGWRAAVHALSPPTARWTQDLLAGFSLGHALERAGPTFGFADWLATALREQWLHRLTRLPAPDS